MNKDEFITKAKELGYSDEDIDNIVKTHYDAEREGIKIPWETDLFELPIETLMSQSRPSFLDSPYFVEEYGNWHLTDDAPEELKKEFEKYMKESGTHSEIEN